MPALRSPVRELGFSITHNNENLTISAEDRDALLKIIGWNTTPEFPRRGRMAWHVLSRPIQPQLSDPHLLRAVKIKGVGAYNPPGEGTGRDPILDRYSNAPRQPTSQPLSSFATYPHLGFDAAGEFCIAFGDTAPVGGILHARALKEYLAAEHLNRLGIPCISPLLVARYENLSFDGKPLGAVLSLVPDPAPYRISEVQNGAALALGADEARDDYYYRILRALAVEGDPQDESTRLQAVRLLAQKVGGAIRAFSGAGLYRYSAEFPNFDFDFDRCEVLFTDLDSTEFAGPLPQMLQELEKLRDAASMLYHLVAKFSSPTALGAYTVARLLKVDPLAGALSGLFPSVDSRTIERASAALWALYLPHFYLLNAHAEPILTVWSQERRRSYKMDHHLFFCAAMIVVKQLADKAADAIYAGTMTTLTVDSLLEKARRFLGWKFEYLERVVLARLSSVA